MIFVNLAVKDIEKSKAFYTAIGFSINPQFTTADSASIVIDENIFIQLHTPGHFRQFITGEISDAFKATEVLNALTASSREEVDATLQKALAAGGKEWKPPQDHGFMYQVSFQDLDGHVWEMVWMDAAAMKAS
jgi:predicted lactoylglutathione lyase